MTGGMAHPRQVQLKQTIKSNEMKINLIGTFLILASLFSACNMKKYDDIPVTIIPIPLELEQHKGAFVLNKQTSISYSEKLASSKDAIELFAENLRGVSGFDILAGDKSLSNAININIDETISSNPEAYKLEVNSELVSLTGQSDAGVFVGLQTLRQLLPKQVEGKEQSDIDWVIPNVSIYDEPRFAWRGMHLDVSRHFFSKAYVKRFIDQLALYKMNRFHWHLTDDQGWRIEIKKYPALTEKGAYRTHNKHDKVCIERAKDNPDMVINPAFYSEINGEKMYGGYYTQEDIKEVVAYASKKGIMVIPEIDMPGHFKAAIDNYPYVSCFGKAGWGETFSSPLCAGKEESFQMVEDILSEVIELFPAPYFHIGADEVEKTNWKKCPDCQARIKNEKLHDEHELQSYFVHRVENFLNSKGKKMIGWDEILEGGMSESATMMYWRGWVPNAPIEAAKQGNDVIMSPTSHCYFDYAQNSGTLQHVYEFEPIPDGVNEKEAKHIIGGQANIWTEYIPSDARADYMSMPRMVALSEALWSDKNQKEWNHFFKRLSSHFERLDIMSINYRIPEIEGLYDSHVFVGSDTIRLTHVIKDQEIRFTTDGSIPTIESQKYTEPIIISEPITFSARPFSKAGRGGDILKAEFVKTNYIPAVKEEALGFGLDFKYYEGRGWRSVKDIGKKDRMVEAGTISTFNLPEKAIKKQSSYALVYNGFIKVEADGVYTFSLLCDDAGVLTIANQLVIDNDGMHPPRKKIGQIALSKGFHPIELQYIEGGGGGTMRLSMLKNGNFEPLNASVLYR
jgi:hexosaminidase